MDRDMKMDRILLKMSGEALAGDKKHGFDEETVRDVSNQVKQIVDKGIQVQKLRNKDTHHDTICMW